LFDLRLEEREWIYEINRLDKPEILFVIIYDKIFDFHFEHLERIFEVLEEVIHDYYSKYQSKSVVGFFTPIDVPV
jgi:hypothetical protein